MYSGCVRSSMLHGSETWPIRKENAQAKMSTKENLERDCGKDCQIHKMNKEDATDHKRSHNCFTALWILSGTTRVSRYQKKHSPTHTYRGHPSFLICFIYYDPWHTPCSIYVPDSLVTISVQVFFGLPPGLAPSTSYSIRFFTQSLSSFRSTCLYHRNLFCFSTKIMSSNPSLFLNPILGTLSCCLAPHIHLTILISARWSANSFFS